MSFLTSSQRNYDGLSHSDVAQLPPIHSSVSRITMHPLSSFDNLPPVTQLPPLASAPSTPDNTVSASPDQDRQASLPKLGQTRCCMYCDSPLNPPRSPLDHPLAPLCFRRSNADLLRIQTGACSPRTYNSSISIPFLPITWENRQNCSLASRSSHMSTRTNKPPQRLTWGVCWRVGHCMGASPGTHTRTLHAAFRVLASTR